MVIIEKLKMGIAEVVVYRKMVVEVKWFCCLAEEGGRDGKAAAGQLSC